MSGGECKIKEPPPHVILGKTQTDQDWIDGEVEVGVTVCGFPRPGPRPAALDAPPATRQVAGARPPAKKKGFIRRVKERVWKPKAEPVVEVPAAITPAPLPPPVVVAAPPKVAPPPQDPVDALLHPRK